MIYFPLSLSLRVHTSIPLNSAPLQFSLLSCPVKSFDSFISPGPTAAFMIKSGAQAVGFLIQLWHQISVISFFILKLLPCPVDAVLFITTVTYWTEHHNNEFIGSAIFTLLSVSDPIYQPDELHETSTSKIKGVTKRVRNRWEIVP